jgi:hypothetical protein
LYEQIQGIRWLGGDPGSFKKEVSGMRTDIGNLYNYEDHHYGVFDQEALSIVCRHLLDLPVQNAYPGLFEYMQVRRRANGSWNNAPAVTGGDGNVLNTYWGLYALHLLGRDTVLKKETIAWLRACQLGNGGFTHQPHPVIGGNDEVAYTWAAVKALDLLSAHPKNMNACIRYLISLHNSDGGFGNRPGLPSTAMSTWYAVDALKTLHALDKLGSLPGKDRSGASADLSGYKVFTVQFQASGNGSPAEAVMLADSLRIHLWGAKNAPAGWVEAAQKLADKKKTGTVFFHADEPYGKNVLVPGMGTFGHILDNYYPLGTGLSIPDSASWQDLSAGCLSLLKHDQGGLVLQIANNEPMARMLLDESIRQGKGYTAISTIHFNQDFLFFLPFLYQYRHQLPFIALQDAHGTESWWWSNDLTAYRTLFLAKEPTYQGMLEALKNNRVVAVRHDSLTGSRTRMLGGAPGVQSYILSHPGEWMWWDEATGGPKRPWAAITIVHPDDSFEVARSADGPVVRIRTWWHTNKQMLLYPLVRLEQLFIDGKPVDHTYVEVKDRKGTATDSYYVCPLGRLTHGQHTVRAVCRLISNNEIRNITQTFSL